MTRVTTIQHFLPDNLGEILNISLFGKIYEPAVPSLSNINQSIIAEFFNEDNSSQGRCWSTWLLAVILLTGVLDDVSAQDEDPVDAPPAGDDGGDDGDKKDEAWEYVTYLKERRCADSYISI